MLLRMRPIFVLFSLLVVFVFCSILLSNIILYRLGLDWTDYKFSGESEYESYESAGGIRTEELAAKYNALGARMRSFCNLPFRPLHGQEGNVNASKYKLEAVFLVTRHGHRAPIFPDNINLYPTSVVCDLSDTKTLQRIGHEPLQNFASHMQREVREALRHVRLWNNDYNDPDASTETESKLVANIYNADFYTREWSFFNLRASPCSSGQLSLFGIVQFLELGRYLRHVYIDRWNLVAKTLSPNGAANYFDATMKVTDRQRTQLSGLAMMYSFLDLRNIFISDEQRRRAVSEEEFAFARMPMPYKIRVLTPWNFCDRPLQPWLPEVLGCNCPAMGPLADHLLIRNDLFEQESVAASNARFDLQQFVQSSSGYTAPNLFDLVDTFLPDSCFALQLPCIKSNMSPDGQRTAQRCMEVSHIEALLSATEQRERSMNELLEQRHYSSVFMYPLLTEIVIRMRSFLPLPHTADGQDSSEDLDYSDDDESEDGSYNQAAKHTRFTFYSGHDYTVSDLLRALGLHRGGWPSYAARIIFELYSSGSYYGVRVLVNGADATRDVAVCSGRTNEDGLCDFFYFERFVLTDMLKQHANASSYFEACTRGIPIPIFFGQFNGL